MSRRRTAAFLFSLKLATSLLLTICSADGVVKRQGAPLDIEAQHLLTDGGEKPGVFDALKVEYEEMAPWYDELWLAYLDKTLKKPLAFLQTEADGAASSSQFTVVDVGCGTGEFLRRFVLQNRNNRQSLPKLIGVEPSAAMLEKARDKFDPQHQPQVIFRQAPAEDLPLPNGSVDVVCSTNAFHFFRNKERALLEMFRILKQDTGKLVITDWCNDSYLVKLYHLLERVRWSRFRHRYPGPLASKELLDLVTAAGFVNVSIYTYSVRFWGVVFWGMQTITANR
jgi:ubiquinone/menaquinone biosynthesis C-methylase UbiE